MAGAACIGAVAMVRSTTVDRAVAAVGVLVPVGLIDNKAEFVAVSLDTCRTSVDVAGLIH